MSSTMRILKQTLANLWHLSPISSSALKTIVVDDILIIPPRKREFISFHPMILPMTNPENIIPKMSESDVFPYVAAEVAQKAIEEGLARIQLSREEVYNIAKRDIEYAHNLMALMMEKGFLPEMPVEEIEAVLQEAITEIKNK